jgi:hypothetical protein
MSEPLTITAQGTPNPNAAKFTLNRVVAAQGRTYRLPAPPTGGAQAGEASGAEAEWAKRLLGIAGITQVFALNNFVSITKTPEADWTVLGPEVERILRDTFA